MQCFGQKRKLKVKLRKSLTFKGWAKFPNFYWFFLTLKHCHPEWITFQYTGEKIRAMQTSRSFRAQQLNIPGPGAVALIAPGDVPGTFGL